MKYKSSVTGQIMDLNFLDKKYRLVCPECEKSRKKKGQKDCEYFPQSGTAFCFHCETTLFKYDPHAKEKEYIIPEWKNKTALSDGALKYFEGRMISQNTLIKMKVYSDNEYMPQTQKPEGVVCFPYFIGEKLINVKFRTKNKLFKLNAGSELVFYNYDAILNYPEIIIVEGEIDALTFIENGFDNVISVPNGANKNLEYLDTCFDAFKNIEKIYLATDQDTKGVELRDELARRLGQEKCYIVSFKECKDANEYFCKYLSDFKNILSDAKPYPVKGIILASDIYQDILSLYENGVQPGLKLGIRSIDEFITWESGRIAVVTGIPGSGKSEFVDFIVAKLNFLHGWKAAYFTPENYPLKFHYAKMFEKFVGKKFSSKVSHEIDFDLAYDHIKENIFYIMPEDDFTVNSIIEGAKSMVKSRGIKIFVIDPYNKVDHKYTDSETQYISRFLDQIITFSKMNNILLILVAHPRKMQKNAAGHYEVPSLYDINGSANFYNKCDYGFTVHRETNEKNVMMNEVSVYWQKIKFKHLGSQGVTELKYNYTNGRFEEGGVDYWDNSNWLAQFQKGPVKDFLPPEREIIFNNPDEPF